jgi:hypothetical protein
MVSLKSINIKQLLLISTIWENIRLVREGREGRGDFKKGQVNFKDAS